MEPLLPLLKASCSICKTSIGRDTNLEICSDLANKYHKLQIYFSNIYPSVNLLITIKMKGNSAYLINLHISLEIISAGQERYPAGQHGPMGDISRWITRKGWGCSVDDNFWFVKIFWVWIHLTSAKSMCDLRRATMVTQYQLQKDLALAIDGGFGTWETTLFKSS